MPNPSATPTPITPPRVPIIDPRTGLLDRAWYMFFYSLFNVATSTEENADLGPHIDVGQIQQQIDAVRQEVETLPHPELGSMAPLEQDNVPWLTFNNAPSPVPTNTGSIYWDGGTTLNLQATPNVRMRIGESEFVYVKASAAITKGQLCSHTGAVGASGVITAAPTPLALTNPNQLVGVAAEDIALNAFGLIQISGDLRGFDTTGTSVGEVWAEGDPLYYNPAYVGGLTIVKPSAPNQKSYIGEVINAGSSGSGSINIRIVPGTVLGGTDSNVQFGALTNNEMIVYDSALGYWKNNSGAGTFTTLNVTTSEVISVSTSSAALRVTQVGTGNALTIEDSANPDSTPFIVNASGLLITGYTSALTNYLVAGASRTPQIQVQGAALNNASQTLTNWAAGTTTTGAAYLIIAKSASGTTGTQGALTAAGQVIGGVQFNGDDGTNFVPAALIRCDTDGAPSTNDMPGRLMFYTTTNGAAAPTERMRIDSAGFTQFNSNGVLLYQGAQTSKAAAATLSGAELITGILQYTGAAATVTLPTGTNIEGALSWSANDVSLDWWVINTGSGTCTIGANGNTTVGTLTVTAGASAHFRIRRTAANTFTVYRLA